MTSQNIFVSKQTKFYTFNEPRVEFKNQIVLICESIIQTRLVNQINLFIEKIQLERIIHMFFCVLQKQKIHTDWNDMLENDCRI